MKNRPSFLAFLVGFGLLWSVWVPALSARSSDDDTPSKKKKKHADSAAVVHKKTTKERTAKSSRHATPARAAHHRSAPVSAPSANDEESQTVTLGPVDSSRPPNVYARSVMLVDARTGEVLYEKSADERRPIASTTKLLTALLVVEAGNLSGTVEVQPIDTICEPTKLYFHAGEHYARNDLLAALLVHSCNDVARALARDNAGSIPDFARKMNVRAAQLGAQDTHFVNPNGLPEPGEEQWSTARDLSKIARVVYGNQTLRPIMATKTLRFQMNSGKVQEFTNTNKVLARFPYCNGMKTGYTDAAGHCLVSSADDGTNSIISVCLGDSKAIWTDSQRLLSWGLAAENLRHGNPAPGAGAHASNAAPAAGSKSLAPAAAAPVAVADSTWTTLSKAN